MFLQLSGLGLKGCASISDYRSPGFKNKEMVLYEKVTISRQNAFLRLLPFNKIISIYAK